MLMWVYLNNYVILNQIIHSEPTAKNVIIKKLMKRLLVKYEIAQAFISIIYTGAKVMVKLSH